MLSLFCFVGFGTDPMDITLSGVWSPLDLLCLDSSHSCVPRAHWRKGK